ncbi:MAG: hypothetical protein N2692_03140, partial [Patescibacteria group bacterium]|nr:hypothetical protein [Patescibacteria group bacterium]
MKKIFQRISLIFLLLIIFLNPICVFSVELPVKVEFPNVIPLTLEKLPLRIIINDPQGFGYPRVPSFICISIAGFRKEGLKISLLQEYNVDLKNPFSVLKFMSNPIQINTELPLPSRVRKIGIWRVVVD